MKRVMTPKKMHRLLMRYIYELEGRRKEKTEAEIANLERAIGKVIDKARAIPAPEKVRLAEAGDLEKGAVIWKMEEGKESYWYMVRERCGEDGFIDAEEEWLHLLSEGIYYVADNKKND